MELHAPFLPENSRGAVKRIDLIEFKGNQSSKFVNRTLPSLCCTKGQANAGKSAPVAPSVDSYLHNVGNGISADKRSSFSAFS